MAYMFTDFELKERVPFLEEEITRLQELCRKNFGIIDDLKKENRKLVEVQIELKDTTTDLAYSLAECPYWDEGHTEAAFKIFTSFAKNIQYILQLPTFVDPLEQLERYGLERHRAVRFLRRYRRRVFLRGSPRVFKCKKCKKRFTSENRFQSHIYIHQVKKRLHCRQCTKTFSTFRSYKEHLHASSHRLEPKPKQKKLIVLSSAVPQLVTQSVVAESMDFEPELAKIDCAKRKKPKVTENISQDLPGGPLYSEIGSGKCTFKLFEDVVCTFKNTIS